MSKAKINSILLKNTDIFCTLPLIIPSISLLVPLTHYYYYFYFRMVIISFLDYVFSLLRVGDSLF